MAVTRMPGKDSSLMTEWHKYRESEQFRSTVNMVVSAAPIAADPKRVESALWAAFVCGFGAAGGTTLETTPV
jgi:hypothetical protein